MKITNEQLSAYLDNALTIEERAMVDRALAESADLRKELSRLRQLGTLLKEIPTPEPSEKFYRRVLEKTKPRPRAWLQWTFPLVGAVAAAMVMIFIAGEKKTPFRQSLATTKSRISMSQPTEERAKTFESSDIVTQNIMGQARGESFSGIDKKMENEAAPKMYSDEISVERKQTIPAYAKSAGAGGVSYSLRDGENFKSESLSKEKGRGRAKDGKEARHKVEGPSIGDSALEIKRDALPVPASHIQIDPSLSNNHLEPGLAAAPPAQRLRADKPSHLQAPASQLERTIPEEALLPREWQGDSSGVTSQREVVIKDAAAWAKLWAEHQSKNGTPPPAPAINFNKSMIVGIFLGDRGSSGYSVQWSSMKEAGKELIVSYRETQPRSGMMNLSVMTQPYYLKVIPRTSRPIRFIKL
jgi:hypothetical protein